MSDYKEYELEVKIQKQAEEITKLLSQNKTLKMRLDKAEKSKKEERTMDENITMVKTHHIKLREEFADDVYDGRKNFEIRFNDRGYQAGDFVQFKVIDKYNHPCTEYPLNHCLYEITYVLNGFGLQDGYVVFGIRRHK